MRLLITRPREDAGLLAAELHALGHISVIEPLLEVHFRALEIAPGRYRGLLATSANGVRALNRCMQIDALRRLDLLAVGPATAREAEICGFQKVIVAGGDVDALADRTAEMLRPDGLPLLHVSGAAAAGDLKGALEARGFAVERMIGYEARARGAFSQELIDDLTGGRIDGVLLYSPRTAVIFGQLIRAAGLERIMERLACFCLSPAVAGQLEALGPARTLVAAQPNQPALLELLSAQG